MLIYMNSNMLEKITSSEPWSKPRPLPLNLVLNEQLPIYSWHRSVRDGGRMGEDGREFASLNHSILINSDRPQMPS